MLYLSFDTYNSLRLVKSCILYGMVPVSSLSSKSLKKF